MNDGLLRLYNHSPMALRPILAGIRGLTLRRWRYGRETSRLIAEASQREQWSPCQWRRWQEERLAYILHRSATRVPYYREHWAARRRRGDRASWEELQNWPVLDKQTLRNNALAFLADDCKLGRLCRERTSGTTGTPLDLWFTRQAIRQWFAMFDVRARLWNGVSRQDRWATLGGQPIVPASRVRPPFWVWNAAMNQLYLSANHVSAHNTAAYIDALNRYEVTHIVSYSSSAAVLFAEARHLGLPAPPRLKAIITMAEPLTPWQRDVFGTAATFQIRESYGMAELVATATECSEGTLHLWPEVGWIEVLQNASDAAVRDGSAGRLVCTSLLNDAMPLVRYAVGDRGAISEPDRSCACGRRLPTVARIEGRTNDLLRTRNGRRVYWVNPIFYGMPLREAQVIQETLDRVRIRYVPAPGFTSGSKDCIVQRLESRLGPIEVIMEAVERVPRGANGKFRAVISHISEPDAGLSERNAP